MKKIFLLGIGLVPCLMLSCIYNSDSNDDDANNNDTIIPPLKLRDNTA